MTVRGVGILVLTSIGGVAACSSDADSAGWDPSISVEVLSEIGESEGDGLVFGLISDVEVLADGSLLVVDRQRAEVLHVSGEGEVIASFGGRGEGPGEFATPMEVAALGASEYVVLDGDRMHLTRVEIEAGDHEYAGTTPIPYPSLHLCAEDGDFVLDPVLHSHAVARIDAEGTATQHYHRIPDVIDESFPPEAQTLIRMWEGMAIPDCSLSRGVTLLHEWSPRVERFTRDGALAWSVELTDHQELRWEASRAGSPEPTMPEGGWAHRGVTLLSLDRDVVLLQLARVTDDPLSAHDDPQELRLLRTSDGAQIKFERVLPRLAHVGSGRAWGWSNVPYPHLVEMSFQVSYD